MSDNKLTKDTIDRVADSLDEWRPHAAAILNRPPREAVTIALWTDCSAMVTLGMSVESAVEGVRAIWPLLVVSDFVARAEASAKPANSPPAQS